MVVIFNRLKCIYSKIIKTIKFKIIQHETSEYICRRFEKNYRGEFK